MHTQKNFTDQVNENMTSFVTLRAQCCLNQFHLYRKSLTCRQNLHDVVPPVAQHGEDQADCYIDPDLVLVSRCRSFHPCLGSWRAAVWCDHPCSTNLPVCSSPFPWNDCAEVEMDEVLVLPKVIIVGLRMNHASPKRALFSQVETEFVFQKATLSCLETTGPATFCLETFYENLSCHEIFLVGASAAPMIVTLVAMEVIYFPSSLS